MSELTEQLEDSKITTVKVMMRSYRLFQEAKPRGVAWWRYMDDVAKRESKRVLGGKQ